MFDCRNIFQACKKMRKGLLYISLWGSFCVTFSLYTIANVIYTTTQDTHFFISNIESVASSGYRSPPALFFQLDNVEVSLIVKNELPVKEKIEHGHAVGISGQYKKGWFSSVMIVDYTIY